MLRPFGELGCSSGCHGRRGVCPEIQFARQYREIGLANTAMAGDILVIRSGVFLYASIARWKLSQSKSPLAGVLPASARYLCLRIAMGISDGTETVVNTPVRK